MEEFVVEIKNNINKPIKSKKNEKNFRFRELVSHITKKIPNISISNNINTDGDIQFSVSMFDLGLSFDSFLKYKNETFSDYIANFLGELLVRENINEFRQFLIDIDVDDYNHMISHYEHCQFGMEILKNKFIFVFHVSLLHGLLTENFRSRIK